VIDVVSALVDMDSGLASALVVIGSILVVIIALLVARSILHGTMKKGS
jgi:hypothetical protein